MAKSPEEMAAAMVANLKEKTGKDMPQWLKIAAKSAALKHGELVNQLKAEYGLTHGYANLVAHRHFHSAASSSAPTDLVTAQYAGKKTDLRPIYDALEAVMKKLGKDVEVAPKKAYVSFRRSKQFALVQPSTATRVDLGLQLQGTAASERLETSGSFNSMVSHRVRLTGPKDVDAELKRWIQAAYASA